MHGKPLKRWILVNYSGYPYAPNSLMPDNGLAILAGALWAAGCEATILDYATVSTLAAMSSDDLSRALDRVWDRVNPGKADRPGLLAGLRALGSLRRAEAERGRLQRRWVARIGDDLVDRIRRARVEAVGFKLWNGDGLTGSVELARRVRRECPGVKVFGGGPHVDMFGKRILDRFPVFDALVYGEGEETIVCLAGEGAAPDRLHGIPNLLIPRAEGVVRTEPRSVENLDDLPFPLYEPEVYPAMAGHEKIHIRVLDESRGCRNHCAFCIHPVKSHRTMRVRGVPRLWREIERQGRPGRPAAFRFAGSCTPYGLLNAFARHAIQQPRRLLYSSFAHVRDGDEADFSLLRQSGCIALFFGVESGSQRVLDRMHKGVSVPQIERTVRRAREAGVAAVCSLIYPAPGDDAETRRETFDLMRRLRPDGVTVQPAGVIPHTSWFREPHRYGIAFPSRDRYVDEAMVWKAKLLLPPSLWRSLPVAVDGRPWRAMLRETAGLARDLEREGIPCALSDDLLLMSACAGTDRIVFRDNARRAFFAGDVQKVREMVEALNAAVG